MGNGGPTAELVALPHDRNRLSAPAALLERSAVITALHTAGPVHDHPTDVRHHGSTLKAVPLAGALDGMAR